MLDLLANDGATTEDLLAPPQSAIDAIDILHSYSFTQQLGMLPQGLELQQSANSPEQASLGLDNPNNVSGSASDAVAAFLSMGQPNLGGLKPSRSMTRLVPTPAQATAAEALLAAAASALPTSSRALAPQGVHISSLPGSPRAVTSASPGNKRTASTTTTTTSDANPTAANDLDTVGSPEPQVPPTGAASKATSTVSDLVPTTHYQSGTSAGSKLLTLLQQNKDTAAALGAGTAVEGSRTRRSAAVAAAAAGTHQQPTGSGTGGKGTAANTPVVSGTNRGGAIFPSGAELLGTSAETPYTAPDPLQQLLDTALQQEQQQDRLQFAAQQRPKHSKQPSTSNMLDFLYDNLLGLPNAAGTGGVGVGASNSRQAASRPPKPASQAMQRFAAGFIAGADSGASQPTQEQQDDPASMDWAGEAVSGGSAGAAAGDDLACDGGRATSSDGRQQDGIKRSSRKRTRTVKAVEAEEEAALLAATGVKRRTNGSANRNNGINAARIYTQQHLKAHAAYHLPPTSVQRPQLQRTKGSRQQQQTPPQQQQSVLQQLQQAAEDMINGSSYLGGGVGGNTNLLGSLGNIYGDMPVDEFLHTESHAGAGGLSAAAVAAAAGFRSVTPGVGENDAGGSAANSMHLQGTAAAAAAAAAAEGDRDYTDDAQTDLLKAAFNALSAGAAAAAANNPWLQQDGGRAAAAAAAGPPGSSRMQRSLSPAAALAALAQSGGWGAGSNAAAAAAGMFDGLDQDTVAGLELAAAAAAAGLHNSRAQQGHIAVDPQAAYAQLPPAPPKQQKQTASRGAAAAAGAAAAGSSAKKAAPKAKGGRKGGGRSAGRARCSDPETSAALAALTALANAAEGVSRFVGDHAKDQDAAVAAAAAAGDAGAAAMQGGANWTTVGGGKNVKIVETGALGGEEEGSRAARGPRAASRFIGVTWRERIQRWEVYVWASSSKRSHYIGAFPTSVHAARAYDVAVLWLMGQDARPRTRLNFPLSDYNLEEIQAEASAVAAMRQLGTHMTSAQRGQAAAQAAQAAAKQAAATVSGSGRFRAAGSGGSTGAAAAAGDAAAAAAGEVASADLGVDPGVAAAAAAAAASSRPSSRGGRGGGSTGVPAAVVAEASAAEAEVAAFMAANAAAAAHVTPDAGNEVTTYFEDHGEVTAALQALEAAEGASPGPDAAASEGAAAEAAGEDVLLPGSSATAAAAEAAGGLMQMHRSSSRQQLIMHATLGASPAAAGQQHMSDRRSSEVKMMQQQQQRSGAASPARTSPDSLACGALDLLQHAAELEAMKRELDGDATAAAAGSGEGEDEATSDDPVVAAAAAATAAAQ